MLGFRGLADGMLRRRVVNVIASAECCSKLLLEFVDWVLRGSSVYAAGFAKVGISDGNLRRCTSPHGPRSFFRQANLNTELMLPIVACECIEPRTVSYGMK